MHQEVQRSRKMIRIKVRVFSDSTLCVGFSQIKIHPTVGQWKWTMYGTNTDLSKHETWQPEKCNAFGTYCQVLLVLTPRCNIQEYLNGQTPEFFDERIMFMSMFNDTGWTKRGNTEICLHNAKDLAACPTQPKPGHWCFQWPASKNTWWNANSNEPQGKYDIVALQIVDVFSCHTSPPPPLPIFPATAPWSLGQLRKGGRNYHFPRHIRQHKILNQNHIGKQFTLHLQSNLPVVWDWKWGTCTEKIGRRRANRSRPRPVIIIT